MEEGARERGPVRGLGLGSGRGSGRGLCTAESGPRSRAPRDPSRHERPPWRGAALVEALSDGAGEREHGVGATTQDGDDESGTWAGFNPGVIVFLETSAEDWMRCFDALVAARVS